MNTEHDHVPIWNDHIRSLAEEIGPRGSTTDQERQASEYCEQKLKDFGYAPQVESFVSARSIYTPHLLASGAMLFAFAIYPLAGRITAVIAALVSLITIISEILELTLRDNILRRLVPKGASQNVIALAPPISDHRQDLVLMGHVDSHRSPLIFSSRRWVATYKAFLTVAFGSFSAQLALYLLGAVMQCDWIWPVTITSAACAVLLMVVCIQANSSPYSPGANDNATGAGLVLTLAEHLKSHPLSHTRVWLVCTGCEEVQHYGARDFFFRHVDEMLLPKALVFEMLGCAGPGWLLQEGILIPIRANPDLVKLIQDLAQKHPEWQAHSAKIRGGNTEMADALLAGVPAITFGGATANGELPYWHTPEDTFDKMDAEVMARAYDMTWTFIITLDAQTVNMIRK